MKNVESYLEKAISNIENDRKITKELLDDVVRYLSKDESRHSQVGLIASKYVETLQRSNEQLVKVATLLHKKQQANYGLTDDDKDDIYNMIQENQ